MIPRTGTNELPGRLFAIYITFAVLTAAAGVLIRPMLPAWACSGVPPFDPSCRFTTTPGELYEDEEITIKVEVTPGTASGFEFPFDTWWRTGYLPIGDGAYTGIDTAAILPRTNKRAIECTGVPPDAAPIVGVNSITFSEFNMSGSLFDNTDYAAVLSAPITYIDTYFPGDTQGYLFHLLPSHANGGSGGAADRFYHRGCTPPLTPAQTSNIAINVVDTSGTTVEVFDATYDMNKSAYWKAGEITAAFDMDPEARPPNGGSPEEAAQNWRTNQGFNGPEKPDDPSYLGQVFPALIKDPATSEFTIIYKYRTPGKYTIAAYAAVNMEIKGTWTWKEKKNGVETGPFSMTINMNVLKTGTGINPGTGGQQTNLLALDIRDKTPPSAVYWTNGSESLVADTGGYITQTASGSAYLTFDVIDNNPKLDEWMKMGAAMKSPISIFYSVQGYDYVKKSSDFYENGIYPLPVEKYFWAEAEVPAEGIASGDYIEAVNPFDNWGGLSPFDESDPKLVTSSNPAGCVVSFKIPLVLSDGSPLFKEPTGWYHGENSVEYTDDFGEVRRGWDPGRLKFFVAINDAAGNVNPPYWMGNYQAVATNTDVIASYRKRVITPYSNLASGTVWDAAGAWEDFLAGSIVGSGVGVQPGYFDGLTDYDTISTTGNAIMTMNQNWDEWGGKWQGQEPLVPWSNPPDSATVMTIGGRSDPDFLFPPSFADQAWHKDNFSKYGFITVSDDDPPSARVNIKDVGEGKSYCWGNTLWGDYQRYASQKVVHEGLDTVYTKTNQDIVNRYNFVSGSIALMAGSPFTLDSIFNVNGGAVLEFGGGAIPEYQSQQTWIAANTFQPWSWNVSGHPMNGVKNSYFIPEDMRIALSGFSVDNINTWNKNYIQGGKNYAFGCLIPGSSSTAENKLYDGTGPDPDKGAVPFYLFRTPNTETGAAAYYYIKTFDSASPTLSDELKLNFKIMDRKVTVHTIDRR